MLAGDKKIGVLSDIAPFDNLKEERNNASFKTLLIV